eukprot:TRINITY_DN11142_c0_g1_i3.p1 TRINITY_DN11142_c0_g1~~TRINITY_DN11142_c0_g1_i3.p1  ORF type:complete len:614 (+),score=115.68 TRINITY_DN11142_c0_g1_i3:23-1864(+)
MFRRKSQLGRLSSRSRGSTTSLSSVGSHSSFDSIRSGSSNVSSSSRVSVKEAPNAEKVEDLRPLARSDRPTSILIRNDDSDKPWSKLVPKSILKKLPKREVQRQQVLHELIKTEQAYLRDLVVIKNLFRQALLDADIIDHALDVAIFANLDDILAINSELHERLLQQRHKGMVRDAAEPFVSLMKRRRFKPYVQFCANQDAACRLVAELFASNPRFRQCMQECEANIAESQGFGLGSFLLKVMQRLLKYTPLLQQVLKYTDEAEHSQRANLNLAIKMLDSFATIVNEHVRAVDNQRRWQLMQETLQFNGDAAMSLHEELHLGKVKLKEELEADVIKCAGHGTLSFKVKVLVMSDRLLIAKQDEDQLVLEEHPALPCFILYRSILRTSADYNEEGRHVLLVIDYTDLLHVDGDATLRQQGDMRGDHEYRLKLAFRSPTALKHSMTQLSKAKQEYFDERYYAPSPSRRGSATTVHQPGIVTLMIRTTTPARDISTSTDSVAQDETDWEISFDEQHGDIRSETIIRQAQLTEQAAGLGMTVIGRGPVIVESVEDQGAAAKAGVTAGDVVCAVDGHDCTQWTHAQVVNKIRQVLQESRLRHTKNRPLTELPEQQSEA